MPIRLAARTTAVAVAAALAVAACAPNGRDAPQTQEGATVDTDVQSFIAEELKTLEPLAYDASLTWFEASVSGTDEAFAKSKTAEDAINRYWADAQRFAKVRAFKDAHIGDDLLRRQVEVLYLGALGKQVPPEMLEKITTLESEVEQAFNTYRGKVGGKELTQNQIEDILTTSKDSAELKAAWEAQKDVGAIVAPKLLPLAKLRNEVAKALGFRDFYALRLAESEIDEGELLALFDELDRLTRQPFLDAKAEVDRRLAKRLGIGVGDLMPWHYQNPFFQEPPEVFDTGLDAMYAKSDTLALCKKFYEGIGFSIDGIVSRSDLYEKQGKTPHAFSTDIDRKGDVRMIANIVPGLKWQQTMIHELGHAVYDEHIDRSLPWLLREASHPLTTEGLAMMIDRVVGNPRWAEAMGVIDTEKRVAAEAEAKAYLTFAPLQFSRWTQVMLRFERELYRDPDQNLNAKWWDLVEEYQGLERPAGRDAPDYASKVHLTVAPVYYHNYMMGDLFGAQVHEAIAAAVGSDPKEEVYVGNPAVGTFLKEKVFGPGTRYSWNELTEHATGKRLSAEAFARRFQ